MGQTGKQDRRNDLFVVSVGVALFYMTYSVVMHELQGTLNDYQAHTYIFLPMFKRETWAEGWMMVPHCLWHLCVLALKWALHAPVEESAAYVSGGFQVASYLVTYWALRRYSEAKGLALGQIKAAAIALGLSVAQSLDIRWLDAGNYLGTFSMNPFHNPTYMCARPFALLCFFLVCDIWGRQREEGYRGIFFRVERGLNRYYGYLAAVLFLSVVAKPTFAEMFILAVGSYMLAGWIGRIGKKDGNAGGYFRQCLTMLLCAVPALVYLIIQFLAYSVWGGSYGSDGSFIVTGWMEVWSLYSENVILSIALGLAFPLFLILIDVRFFLRESMGRLALTGYAAGLLEAALLGEEGEKLSHGNFLWPMMSGMLLLWAAALLRLLVLDGTQADTRGRRLLVGLAWALFCAHVLFGFLYIAEMAGI